MFLLRPPPLPGESLSSWRQRAGEMNGFSRYPQPKGISALGDPDRLYSSIESQWLQREFRLAEEELRRLTLESSLESLGASLVNCEDLHWILSHRGIFSQKVKAGGPMFCPFCLQSDEIPFMRVSWRLAIRTHCEVHTCLLEEECPSCRSFIWPVKAHVKASFASLPFNFCRWCGESLCQRQGSLIRKPSEESYIESLNSKTHEVDVLWRLSQLLLDKRSQHLRDYVADNLGVPELLKFVGTSIRFLPIAQRILAFPQHDGHFR